MPAPLRHPAHLDEALSIIRSQIESTPSGRKAAGAPDLTTLRAMETYLVGLVDAIYAYRDRRANMPIPTKAGDLIPGSTVNIKCDSGYQKRTINGAEVGSNPGITQLGEGYNLIHLSKNGQTLRVQQRDIVEITVVHGPATPIHGG